MGALMADGQLLGYSPAIQALIRVARRNKDGTLDGRSKAAYAIFAIGLLKREAMRASRASLPSHAPDFIEEISRRPYPNAMVPFAVSKGKGGWMPLAKWMTSPTITEFNAFIWEDHPAMHPGYFGEIFDNHLRKIGRSDLING